MKRRAGLLLLAMIAALLLASGVALAATITCKSGNAASVFLCAGTNNADQILGNQFDNYISARGGNDEVQAGDGADRVFGGAGDDELLGDFYDRDNIGDLNHDTVSGGAGDDILFGGNGRDNLVGGTGDDEIDAEELGFNSGVDTVMAGSGDDLIVSQDEFPDNIRCGPGYDMVIADFGDTVNRDQVNTDCEETNLPSEQSTTASAARAEELRAKIRATAEELRAKTK